MTAIIRWTPFLESSEEMEKMMNDMTPATRMSAMGFTPAVDMYEDKDNVIIETQLAGVDPDGVDIAIENDVLTIKGESEKKSEIDEKNYYRKEIRRGSFYRSVPLPTHVIGDKATAEAIDGVLKVTVPKAPEAKPKVIKIKTAKK
jgi:HSP20 family protein